MVFYILGGPAVPHKLGRSDDKDGARCPPNGLLPDAAQGAQHLRDGLIDSRIKHTLFYLFLYIVN